MDTRIKSSDTRKEWVILILLFLIGLAFRLPTLTERSLWLDEAWRVALAESPLRSLSEAPIALFNQIFSYYGLLRCSLNIWGHSEMTVRIMPALFGALAVSATYRLGRVTLDRVPAVLGALLLCLSPLHITYSQEGAAYSTCSLLIPVFLIYSASLTQEVSPRKLSIVATAAAALGLAFIYLLAFVVVALGLYAFSSENKRFKRFTLGTLGIATLSSIPIFISYLPRFGSGLLGLRDMNMWLKSYPTRIINSVVSGPLNDAYGSFFLHDYYVPSVVPDAGLAPKVVAWTALLTVLVIMPCRAIIQCRASKIWGVWLSATASYVIFLILQSFFTNNAEVRYIVPILPVLYVLLASVVGYNAHKWRQFGAFAVFILLVNFIMVTQADPPGTRWKPDARSIAMRINQDSAHHEGVVLIVPEVFEVPIYEFYLRQSKSRILRQSAYEGFFYENDISLLRRTPEQKKSETEWFVKSLLNNRETVSSIFIVSQRDKDRANEIADALKPVWGQTDKSETDHILVIKLWK